MGINLAAVSCDNCGTTYTPQVGPNWTVVNGPPGGASIVYTCVNGKCKKILGMALIPTQR